MKKRSYYMKFVTAVLFLIVVVYFSFYIANALRNTFATMTAVSYTVELTLPTEGFVVRTESVIHDTSEMMLPLVREGERVRYGQDIAVEYLTISAIEIASEIRTLRLVLAQHEESTGAAASAMGGFQSIMDLSRAVQSGNLNHLDELSLRIESTIFGSTLLSEQEVHEMRARLSLLERQRHGMRIINAPASGFFSQVTDGFEHIGPSDVRYLSPTELMELFAMPSPAVGTEGAEIKLITEFRWYYAAIMNGDDAVRLALGRTFPIQFMGAFQSTVDMRVERISRREDGRAMVLFSTNRGIHNITMQRELQAEVLFGSITGIRVPKEAVHLDDNGITHIFLQTGARAERVNIDILTVSGGHYIVLDGTYNNTPLRAGSTIIVRANNIYDGRIVI